MLHNACILGGSQTKGDKITSGCLTTAFSGVTRTIWHIPNVQEALKTHLWNNKLVEKGQNSDLSIDDAQNFALWAHYGQGIPLVLALEVSHSILLCFTFLHPWL